ncbi:MAG: hypothetical protein JJU02_10260 [Cryomorphaceae bacterium]|nr:hypothetical protein [Cryomorphaceae bacterium]
MFEQFFHQSSDKRKLEFLNEAFKKYPDLKEDFTNFYLKPSGKEQKMTIDGVDEFIQVTTDLVISELEAININDPDWENYVPRHNGYIPDYEAMEHIAEDKIEFHINLHLGDVERLCSEQQFELAFFHIIGVHDACLQAKLDDEYSAFEDANLKMIQFFECNLQTYLPLFKSIKLSEDQLFTIANGFFDHHHAYYSDHPDFLTLFDIYLEALVHTGAEANILLDLIEEKNIKNLLPRLVTELQKKAGGQLAWEQSALKYYKLDIQIARSLLVYYRTNNKPEFVKIARILWHEGYYLVELAKYFFDNLDISDDPELYKEITKHLNNRGFSEEYYRILQTLMNREERLNYIHRFKRDKPAYVRALFLEGENAKAIEFIGLHLDRYNFVEIITPCLQAQPKSALEILEIEIGKFLIDERGRNFYNRIAQILKTASEIPEIRTDVKKLAAKLYTDFSRLVAFRDELRSVGLV